MTPEQYEHWEDFALRMARTCYATHRRPSGQWVLEVVEDWFDDFDKDDIPCIVNWDHSTEYPEGNPNYGREYARSYCDCDGWRDKHKRPNLECPECRGRGVHHALLRAPCVGDTMSTFLDGYRPRYWPRCRACDGPYDATAECVCDDKSDLMYRQWEDQWDGPVHCCIRAGLDCAAGPSVGVLGFTKGDIEKMYPEGVPDWVKGEGPWNAIPIKRIIPGVGFVPGEPIPNGMWDEMPADAKVWL